MRNKQALSPVVSTVLLISLVIILAIIIFLWARGFIKEAIEKPILGEDVNIEEACRQVSLRVSLLKVSGENGDYELSLINAGDVNVYKINLKKQKKGDSEVVLVEDMEDLRAGQSRSKTLSNLGDYEEITIIPVLLGKSENKNKEYTCDEKHGFECVKEGDDFIC